MISFSTVPSLEGEAKVKLLSLSEFACTFSRMICCWSPKCNQVSSPRCSGFNWSTEILSAIADRSIRSSAILKSLMVSVSPARAFRTKVSLPAPPRSMSSPAPPSSTSSPVPPLRLSTPAPPYNTSFWEPPLRSSSPAPPISTSSPISPSSISVPAPPYTWSSPTPPRTTSSPIPALMISLPSSPRKISLPAPP